MIDVSTEYADLRLLSCDGRLIVQMETPRTSAASRALRSLGAVTLAPVVTAARLPTPPVAVQLSNGFPYPSVLHSVQTGLRRKRPCFQGLFDRGAEIGTRDL